MLSELEIKNYALIQHLHLTPNKALNVITGETGAGKSIMLGAIGLLMGHRADTKALFNTDEKCVIEGHFDIKNYKLASAFEQLELDYQDITSIRREISPSGKSRAFINDTPVNLDVLREISAKLLDVHSQHDNLQLGNNLYQLMIVDIFAQNIDLKNTYFASYQKYTNLQRQLKKRQKEYQDFQKEYDYNHFLYEELQKSNLQPDEQVAFEQELERAERAEEIKVRLHKLVAFLSQNEPSVLDEMRGLGNALGHITNLSPAYLAIQQRLESCRLELDDLAQEAESEAEDVEYNPMRTEEIQERLSLLYNLQKKHNVDSVPELLKIQEILAEKINKVLNFDDEIATLKNELATLKNILTTHAENLSESRKNAIPQIVTHLLGLLMELGMPNASIKIEINAIDFSPEGTDLVNLLFSANKGVSPQEISKVASGGEFSRLMLCIKYILAQKTALPTIIFDEIDTGISGEIALKMGKMFQTMAQHHQIIAISHLHQIAAKGNHHYFVFKDNSLARTFSRIRQLTEQERIYEIAQMISGASPSESAILSAKELLES